MKFLVEAITDEIIEFDVSSEHKKMAGSWFGYMCVNHPRLGEFFVSVSANGENIRTDGYPWNFLKASESRLTAEQVDYINSIKDNKKLQNLIRNAVSFTNKDFE